MVGDLLNFITKHPKTISVALFSIIVVGSVGGGFWINTLDAKVNSVEERINLINEKHKKSSVVLKHQNDTLNRQISTLKNDVMEVTTAVDELVIELEAIIEQQDNAESLSSQIGLLASKSNSLKLSSQRAEDINEISTALTNVLSERRAQGSQYNDTEFGFFDLTYWEKKALITHVVINGIIGYFVIILIVFIFKRFILNLDKKKVTTKTSNEPGNKPG